MNEHDPSWELDKEEVKDENPEEVTELYQNEGDELKACVKSPYLSDYQRFLSETKDSFDIIHFREELQRHRIIYTPNRFANEPCITFLSESKNKQIISLSVSLSHFNFELHLLNLEEFSPTEEQLSCLGFGSMGTTYCYEEKNGETFVIKGIDYNAKELMTTEISSKLLESTILECCYSKLFSALKIGPAFLNPFGFDLLVYKEKVEFMLEYCEKITTDTELLNLNESLKIMHKFRIIHGDIKPENIMWSYKFKKLVFIDFGLTKIVKENVGELTVSKYFGSYLFSIKEMQELFFNKSVGYIDLYYNDVHSLLMSEKQNKKQENEKPKKKLKPKTYTEFYETHMQNICLVYYIFTKKFQNIKECINLKKPKILKNITIQIFIELPASESLTKIKNALSKKFNFPKEITEEMQENIKNTGKLANKNKNKRLEFTQRVKEICNSNMIPLHNTMIIIKIFFDQDISANGLNHKKILEENLKKIVLHDDGKEFNPEFWNKFLEYTENLFSQKEDVENMLSIALKYLGEKANSYEENELFMKKISHKSEDEKSYFCIYLKACKIVEVVKEKYGINLTELNNENNINKGPNKLRYYLEYFHKNIQKNMKEIETLPNILNLCIPLFELIEGYHKSSDDNNISVELKKQKEKLNEEEKKSGIIIIYEFIEFLLEIENKPNIQKELCYQYYEKFIHHGIINKSKLAKYTYQILYFSEEEQSKEKIKYFEMISNKIFYNYCFETNQIIEFLLQNVSIKNIYEVQIINVIEFKQELTYIMNFIRLLKHNYDAINKINHFIFAILADLKGKFKTLELNDELNYYLHEKIKSSLTECVTFCIEKLLEIVKNLINENNLINTLIIIIGIIGIIPSYLIHIENEHLYQENILPDIQNVINHVKEYLTHSSMLVPYEEYTTLLSIYDAEHKMKLITQEEFYEELKHIEILEKYKNINKFQIYIFYAYLSQFINIDLESVDRKLMNESNFEYYVLKMFISSPYLSLLLTYYKTKCIENSANEENMLIIIERIVNITKLKPINNSEINNIYFQYYETCINNIIIYSEGSKRFEIAITEILNLFKNKFEECRREEQPMDSIKKLSNALPIFEALMMMSTHLPENCNNFHVFELAEKFFHVLKYVSIFLPYSNPFYCRRIKNMIELFILNLDEKNIPILEFYKTAPPENYKRNEKYEEWVKIKRIRSQQYSVYESEIDNVIEEMSIKYFMKYEEIYEYNYVKQNSYVYQSVKECITEKLKNINYNKNLNIYYENEINVEKSFIGKYLEYLNQKEVQIEL